jgi:hypothetical protein
MKELEQKALDLLYNHSIINPLHNDEEDIKHATQSVNHTIYTLKKLKKVMAYKVDALNIEEAINEQIELKKILEGRL